MKKALLILIPTILLLAAAAILLMGNNSAAQALSYNSNDFNTLVDQKDNNLRAQFSSGGSQITFLLSGQKVKKTSGSSFNLSDNVSIDYEIKKGPKEQGLKETITLKNKEAPNEFSFNLNLENISSFNPDPANKSWHFYNSQNKEVFYIPAGFMVDAKGIRSEEVQIAITKKSSNNVLTVTADKNWLADPARAYPVQIDPSVILTTSSEFASSTDFETQRKIVRTSDGTINAFVQTGTDTMTCGGSSLAGLLRVTSTDGTTWTCQNQLSATTTYFASIMADSSDNLYIVYTNTSVGTTSDVNYRKFTYNGASSWTMESAQAAVDSTSATTGYNYGVIELEGTTRIWLAVRYFDGTNYQVNAYYSDGLGTAPVWTSSATLDTATTSSSIHIPAIVRYSTNIGVIYNYTTPELRWRTRVDTDSLTSWVTEATVADTSSAVETWSSTVDNSNNVHVAVRDGVNIKYTYYNSSSWSSLITLSTIADVNTGSPQISTDGTAVYVIYDEQNDGFTNQSVGQVVYKKGVSPYALANFNSTSNKDLDTSSRIFDKVWSFISSAYSDETTDAASIATGDISMPSTSGDIIYFGMSEKFRFVTLTTSTTGAGGTLTYEYWNGSSWASLTLIGSLRSSYTSSCTSIPCGVWYTPPSDWVTTTVNGEGTSYYYVRARATVSYTTTPIGRIARARGRIDNLSVPKNISSALYAMWEGSLGGGSSTRIIQFATATVSSGVEIKGNLQFQGAVTF